MCRERIDRLAPQQKEELGHGTDPTFAASIKAKLVSTSPTADDAMRERAAKRISQWGFANDFLTHNGAAKFAARFAAQELAQATAALTKRHEREVIEARIDEHRFGYPNYRHIRLPELRQQLSALPPVPKEAIV